MDAAEVLFDLGRRVAELREVRGLTQDALSELLEIDPSHLRRIEAGRLNIGVRMIVRLTNALELQSVQDLFVAPSSRATKPPGRPRRRKSVAR